MELIAKGFSEALRLIFSLDPKVFEIVWLSLRVSLAATVLASIVSIPLGLLIGSKEFFGRRVTVIVASTLQSMPTVVVGLIIYAFITRRGLLGPMGLLYSTKAIILGEAVLIIPLIVSLTIAATSKIDPRVSKTARGLGAGRFAAAMAGLAEIRFALGAAVIAGYARVVGEVGVAMTLGGNIEGKTRTMPTAIAQNLGMGEFGFCLALGIVLLSVALVVNIVFQLIQGKVKE